MKYSILLILTAILLAGCDNPPTTGNSSNTPELFADADPSKFPVLVVDDEHELDGTNTVAVYQLPAGDGMRLDITKYQFTFHKAALTPNMIMLVMDKEHRFELLNPTETNIYVIDRRTLKQTGARGFPGFRPGEHWVVSVGREVKEEGSIAELISWEGKIEVK